MKSSFLTIAVLAGAVGLAFFWFLGGRTAPELHVKLPVSQPADSAVPNAPAVLPAAASATPPTPDSTANSSSELAAPATALPTVAATATSVPTTATVSTPTVAAEGALPPQTLLENMRTTMRQYGLMFGGNPVGTNPEITQALDGNNPKHVKFLGPDGNRVNAKGELVDSWGTPYFFHQLSAMEMEIRSAGPDQIMWSADDLVIK